MCSFTLLLDVQFLSSGIHLGMEMNQINLGSRLAIIVIIIGTGTSLSVYILTNDWYLCEVVLRIVAVREPFFFFNALAEGLCTLAGVNLY